MGAVHSIHEIDQLHLVIDDPLTESGTLEANHVHDHAAVKIGAIVIVPEAEILIHVIVDPAGVKYIHCALFAEVVPLILGDPGQRIILCVTDGAVSDVARTRMAAPGDRAPVSAPVNCNLATVLIGHDAVFPADAFTGTGNRTFCNADEAGYIRRLAQITDVFFHLSFHFDIGFFLVGIHHRGYFAGIGFTTIRTELPHVMTKLEHSILIQQGGNPFRISAGTTPPVHMPSG